MSAVPPNGPFSGGRDPAEPGRQPANPADLRRVPPATPECTRVRGWLRDFADGDLGSDEVALVEAHVHRCRECAVELARAEHEVLRLRRAGAAIPPVVAPAGFAAAVVDRLLADLVRTPGVRPPDLRPTAAATATAEPDSEAAAKGGSFTDSGVWRRRDARASGSRLGGAFAAIALLAAVVVTAIAVTWEATAEVYQRQRVIVTSAKNTFEHGEIVQSGSLPTDTQVSVVGGELTAEMHDGTTLSQPAAQVRLSGDGQIRVIDGRPTLVAGSLEVNAHRPVSIEVADKTRVELGAGRYVIEAGQFEIAAGELPPIDGALGPDAAYRVLVRSGEDAAIVREGAESVVLTVGSLGVWKGASDVRVTTFAGDSVVGGGLTRTRAEPPPTVPSVVGNVFCSNGDYGAGASVGLRFLEHGAVRLLSVSADAGGEYSVPAGRVFDRDFLVVHALPPADRPTWSVLPPRAVPLAPAGGRIPVLMFDDAPVLAGTVLGGNGLPRHGARVIPCVLDPVFGLLLPGDVGAVSTDQDGGFLVPRLPGSLAPLQELALLFIHPTSAARLVPIPLPKSPAFGALASGLRVTLADVREMQIRGLARNARVELFESLADVPAAMGRRAIQPRTTNAQGMTSMQSGGGQLWVKVGSPSRPQLRALVPAPAVPGVEPPVAGNILIPSTTLVRDFDAVFAPAAQSAWNFGIASQFRDEVLSLPARGEAAAILALDERSGHAVAGTCLYAIDLSRGRKTVRLLGITGGRAPLMVDLDRAEQTIVGIAVDGGLGHVSWPSSTRPERLHVPLRAPGVVVLRATARPATGEYEGIIPLRFVPRGGHELAGTPVVVTRFACGRNNFEVDQVPPGDYSVTVGDRAFEVTVPAGGVIELR